MNTILHTSLLLAFGLLGAACAHAKGHGEAKGDHRVHGTVHHRFDDAEAWAKTFEDPARDAWQKPDEVIAALGLTPTSRVADIGSATGYFPVRLARAAPQGRVWGVDIEPSMVRFLGDRARAEGITNLFSVLGTPEDPLLPEAVDLILIVDTYHHIGDRPAYFRRLLGRLKPGGRVAVVDFRMGEIPVGPDESRRLAPETVTAEMTEAGYQRLSLDESLLPYQYLAIFGKRGKTTE